MNADPLSQKIEHTAIVLRSMIDQLKEEPLKKPYVSNEFDHRDIFEQIGKNLKHAILGPYPSIGFTHYHQNTGPFTCGDLALKLETALQDLHRKRFKSMMALKRFNTALRLQLGELRKQVLLFQLKGKAYL